MRSMRVLWIMSVLVVHSLCAELVYVDFDRSMRKEEFLESIESSRTLTDVGIAGSALYDFFHALYIKNNFLTITPACAPKIPKIMHWIWIGKEVPEKFKQLQQGWVEMHPDWEIHIWRDKDIETFGFRNYDLIKKSRNPGAISDLMRYEILYRYGGVYVDYDFECLQPLDELSYLYDFYIGIQPLDCGFVQLGTGLVGSIPGHPLLKQVIEDIRARWSSDHGDVPKETGPVAFTQTFLAHADKGGLIDVALPAHYFYPLGCKEYNLLRDQWLYEGSFGIHRWAASWLRPEYRRAEFRDLNK